MKLIIRPLFLLLCCVALLCAPAVHASQEPLSIVCTIFPAYDFARQLAGDTAQVTLLLPPGGDCHSYEPSPRDIIRIQEADLFLYGGGESDHWVEEILSSMGDDAPRAFRLTDCVTLLAEETTESMEAHHEEAEMDEHVWTSPKNAMRIVEDLSAALCEIAPENADAYGAALTGYLGELEALDAAFEETVAQGKRDLIVFGDRFPFRYFAHDYHLRYDAAFPGCSEDSEPSVRTVISLVETVRAEQVPVIFYIEFSSRKTADILAEETGAKPLLFHSCHNVSAQELEAGATYLSLMWQNVSALKEALN